MKRTSRLLAMLILAISVFAGPSGAAPHEAVAAEATPLLVYELPACCLDTNQPLEVDVYVAGELSWQERITILGKAHKVRGNAVSAATRIELLAAEPVRRSFLGHLASEGVDVHFRLRSQGQEVDRLEWGLLDELGRASSWQSLSPIEVQAVKTARGDARPASSLYKALDLEACIDRCENEYQSCGSTPACQTAFRACVDRCGSGGGGGGGGGPTCEYEVRTLSVTNENLLLPQGIFVCYVDFFGPGDVLELYQDGIKRTTVKETTETDCTVTLSTEVDYFPASSFVCWTPRPYACTNEPVYVYPQFLPYTSQYCP